MNNRIRILATSDVHGYIYPYLYSNGAPADLGLAKLNTLISALRDENTLLIDNGDMLEGSPLSFYHLHHKKDEITPMSKVMKEMKYDYVNLGNHDFNYGTNVLFQHLNAIDAPCITSNLTYRGKQFGPTYVIRQIAGKKIALFGIVTQYIPHWEKKSNIKSVKFSDAFETAQKTVELVRRLEKPDYVIGFYHGGFERDLETGLQTEDQTGENEGYRMLKEIRGLDILVTGHQHRSLAGKKFDTVYTQTACNGQELACIDIFLDTGIIEPRILKADIESDESIEKLVQNDENECQKWLDTPLGTTAVHLGIEDENEARLNKSQLITYLNHVAQKATGAQLTSSALFLGATGFKKEITMRDLVSTYVYPNTLIVKKVTGAVLREYLEKDAEFWTIRGGHIIVSPWYDYPKPQHYNYDMVDGIEYTITVSNPVGERITSLTYQGTPVTDDMEFTLCVNNYRASGGGNFGMIQRSETVKEVQKSMVELLAEDILEQKVIDFEPIHNIQVKL